MVLVGALLDDLDRARNELAPKPPNTLTADRPPIPRRGEVAWERTVATARAVGLVAPSAHGLD